MPSFPLRSTGQTAEDLHGLDYIGDILGLELQFHPAENDPNYKPPNLGRPIPFVVAGVVLACTTMVAAKLITTHRHRRIPCKTVLFLEDWLIVLSLLLVFCLSALSLVGYFKWQWGWHGRDVRLFNYVWNYKIFYIWFVINLWASCAIRASLVLTVRRMYSPFKTKLLRTCDFLLCLKVLLVTGGTLGITFACGVNLDILDVYKWTPEKCDDFVYTMVFCAAGVILDLVIISLPIPLVYKLKRLTRRKKVEVCIIFSLGFLAVTASCVRMYCFVSDLDANANAAYLAIASLVELCISLCTTCIPSARVLFTRLYSPDRSMFDVKAYFRKESLAEPLFAFTSVPVCRRRRRCRQQRQPRVSSSTRSRASRIASHVSSSFRGTSNEIRMSQVHMDTMDTAISASTMGTRSSFDRDMESGDKYKEAMISPSIISPGCPSSVLAFISGEDEKENHHYDIQEKLRIPKLPNKAFMSIEGSSNNDNNINDDNRGTSDRGNVRVSVAMTNEPEDEDEFEDVVVLPEPSDSFFPWATALSPRPTALRS